MGMATFRGQRQPWERERTQSPPGAAAPQPPPCAAGAGRRKRSERAKRPRVGGSVKSFRVCRTWGVGVAICHLRAFVQPRNGRILRPPMPGARRRGQTLPPPGKGGKDGLRGGVPGAAPARAPPLLGDALGQLGAGGRGVGREDPVAGAGGVHGRACGGAGSRGAEGRGHGARGQQQQLLGHRPARAGLQPGTVPTEAAARPGGPAAEDAKEPGRGGERSKMPTVLVLKATTHSAGTRDPGDPVPQPPEGQWRGHRPLRGSGQSTGAG